MRKSRDIDFKSKELPPDFSDYIDGTFFKYIFVIASTTIIVSTGCWQIVNMPLINQTRNFSPIISVFMAFICVGHIRAIWFVPVWVMEINIFFDFGTSLFSILFYPSVYGICYVVIHGGFQMMYFFDNNRFRAIFKTREALGRLYPITVKCTYYLVTIFEIIYQLWFIYLHGSIGTNCSGLIAYIFCDKIEISWKT